MLRVGLPGEREREVGERKMERKRERERMRKRKRGREREGGIERQR